jgi:ribonucleoside-diphosphate reductase alpha chain
LAPFILKGMSQIIPDKISEPIPKIVKPGRPAKPFPVTPPKPDDLAPGKWSEQAVKILEERYLLKDQDGRVIETPDQMCWRVAWDIALAEANFGKGFEAIMAQARDYYQLMASHEFLPNSPTLANAGKGNNLQYSACFVLPVEDSIEGIFDGIKWQALIHKSGGGTGFSFSRLRQSGAIVGSTKGVASGPVSFMKIYDAATEQVKQGGMRRGANMGILRVDHPDILEFIHCKESGGITNFNISVAATDKFMEAYFRDEEYELLDPKTKQPVKKLKAGFVMEEIANGAWRTGDPGMIFIDKLNEGASNPVPGLGPVEATNPCGEQPLYPFDACNLGSIFLSYFVSNGEINWEKLARVTKIAVRFLDSVIERNPFPLPQIKETVTNIRRIGLGVGGWADMLAQLGIAYDSEAAVDLAEKVMAFINQVGHEASQELAQERGPFPLFAESIFKDGPPIRNATVTTIAPTGTIGIIANASTGIEPFFALAFKHHVKTNAIERTMFFTNPVFEEVAAGQPWYTEAVKEKIAAEGTVAHIDEIPEEIKRIFVTAHEIAPSWHVRMQAAFQKHTDNAVSKTINLPNSATAQDIKDAYVLAYRTGCKGITVYRDGCKETQVLNVGNKGQETGNREPSVIKELPKRPIRVEGATYRIETPLGTAFITVNHDEENNPYEVFINIGKAGSEVAAMAEALGRLISTTLRFGNHRPAKERALEIVDQLSGIGGAGVVGFGTNRVKSLPDAVAKAIAMHFGVDKKYQGTGIQYQGKPEYQILTPNPLGIKRDLCPSCGAAAFVLEEGCSKCYACGFSKC